MKTIEKLLCKTMHDFVKEHIAEIIETYDNLGFKNEKDMLSQIRRKPDIAAWALTELCTWGFGINNDYASKFFLCDSFTNDLDYYIEIFKLNDGGKERYCRIEDYGIVVEVNKVTKMVKVTKWEDIN